MTTTTLKSENIYYLRMIALVVGGCVCFVAAYFASAASLDAPYWQLPEGIGAIALTAGGIACFAYIRNFNNLEIDNEALTVKSVLGSHKKTIALNEITGYTETSHTNKGKTHFELTVYTSTGKHRLLSYAYGNYDDLKALLTTGQRHDTARETELKRNLAWFMGAAFIVIGTCMCVAALTVDNNTNGPLPSLAQVTGVITNQPHISKGSKGSRSVHIRLEQYPQFDFVIKRPEYDAMLADDYVNYVSPYDTLQLMIEEDDLLMKLTKTKEPSFEKKHAWYYHIDVYGLSDSSRSYLTPAGIVNNQGDHIGMVILGMSGLFSIGMGMVFIVRGRKMKVEGDRSL